MHRTKGLEERQGWIAGLASPPQPRLCEQGLEEDWYSRSGARPTLSDALAIFLRQAFDPLPPIYDIILLDCPSHLSPLARARLSLASAYDSRPGFELGTKQLSGRVGKFIAPDLPNRNFVLITRFRDTKYAYAVASACAKSI